MHRLTDKKASTYITKQCWHTLAYLLIKECSNCSHCCILYIHSGECCPNLKTWKWCWGLQGPRWVQGKVLDFSYFRKPMIYFKTANITVLKNWIGCQNKFELLFIVINIPSYPIFVKKDKYVKTSRKSCWLLENYRIRLWNFL